jgi:hypothetical protein
MRMRGRVWDLEKEMVEGAEMEGVMGWVCDGSMGAEE